jgi:hypothetical protein
MHAVRRISAVLGSCALASALAAPAVARELSLEQRIEAQRAIERVYHAHRIGADRPLDEAVPESVLRAKTVASLRKSVALERYWNTPVTDRMLSAELDRISRESRMPERLDALFEALDRDPFLVKETLVRAAVVDRLARRFFERDVAIHEAGPRTWDDWWSDVASRLDPGDAGTAATDGGALPETTASSCTDGTWNNASLDDLPDPRSNPTVVWTGAEMIVWGGYNGAIVLGTGGRYDPAIDHWTPTGGTKIPQARHGHTAVWTGSRMIVWGGATTPAGGFTNGGSSYDPVTDDWTGIASRDAPSPRRHHTAVWTGTEMIVWGGSETSPTGGRYDPASNTWTATTTTAAPTARAGHTAVWTGTEMIVWGGRENVFGGAAQRTGARYDPAADTWTPTLIPIAVDSRLSHTAVWTGSLMIVWGGDDGGGAQLRTGGLYDPAADQWAPTPRPPSPPRWPPG